MERLKTKIEKLEKKYFDFVWLARKTEEQEEEYPDVHQMCEVIRNAFPEEYERLSCPDRGDFEHGRNSGILAAVRLIGSYVDGDDEDIAYAEEEFPFLDT